jgi:hypothetical protein
MHAVVHRADIQDRDGGILVLASMFGLYPFLEKLFADGGYQGPQFRNALAKELPRLSVEIVKRSDSVKGFKVLPRESLLPSLPAGVGAVRSPKTARRLRRQLCR